MKKSIFLFSLIYLASCTESAQSLIDNNGDQAQTQFDHFYACYELAKTVPPITKDEINWKTNDANTEYGSMNVYQIGMESFKDLSRPLDVPLDGTRRREHADMAKLFHIDLSSHVEPHNYQDKENYGYHEVESGESCRKAINHFLDTKYLLINRLLEHSEPVYVGNDTYNPGIIHGDVLVFAVESHALLGGFQVTITSDDQISLHENSDIHNNLMADLGLKAYRFIIEKFHELTPSSKDTKFDF